MQKMFPNTQSEGKAVAEGGTWICLLLKRCVDTRNNY
jgi:hypothetical protein